MAALHFPALTGRVVDEAGILSSSARQNLDQLLAEHETQTTEQVVVVTLKSLEGTSIEDYGYQLGRAWAIGQKGKNNGVLLIVAPQEKKVRIEVGYGLEGTLTDALSSSIIQTNILPEFRSGRMENGIVQGTKAILSALNGKSYSSVLFDNSLASPVGSQNANTPPTPGDLIAAILIFGIILLLFVRVCWDNPTASQMLIGVGAGMLSNSGGFGSGFGGGFSGGGGSFGGGGASGGW